MTLIGVDIGGSHISAAQISWNAGEIVITNFTEADVDTRGSIQEIIADWSGIIRKASGNSSDNRLGIAMPGPFDYPNGISLIKYQGKMKSLYGHSVKILLAESLGMNPQDIAFTNDAESFLLGESMAGAGKGFENSMGLTLGTGLGSAIKIGTEVKDAKLWTAPFRTGIAEDYLGTGWFRRYALEKHGLSISEVKDLIAEDFDHSIGHQIFAEFGKSLGEFLSQYVIRLQCQGVVLGGKIAKASDLFLPYTQAYLDHLHYPIAIKVSKLGEKSTLLGACSPFIKT